MQTPWLVQAPKHTKAISERCPVVPNCLTQKLISLEPLTAVVLLLSWDGTQRGAHYM
jgi:hypothetical protein